MHETIQLLLKKYNTAGPRYTSYPTAPVWSEQYDAATHLKTIQQNNRTASETGLRPLSIYNHLPFCEQRCLFCSCNVVITQQREQAEKYLGYLFKEVERVAALMDTERPVIQLHWGGGTPTYLSESQMVRLFQFQEKYFKLTPDAEIAIEIDPRVTTPGQITLLKELGFNRLSLGVQDFNPAVQQAIHRVQPLEMTTETVEHCRALGFTGLNFDLIYGLPHQTVNSFEKTVSDVIALSPDRIALYSYAHVPWLSAHQTQIDETTLPTPEIKFQILQVALEQLTDAGYRYIGMDHFAKPNDELSLALDNGSLHRNFMGYTVHQEKQASDLYGFGVSAISGLTGYFAQNWRKLSQYYDALDAGNLAVMRGYALSHEDRLRQQVILNILCQGVVLYPAIEEQFGIVFRHHFKTELDQLLGLVADGLVKLEADRLVVTPTGRLLSRNIAMPFDAYLKNMPTQQPMFSKTI
jgi:oxygen-independent coproporphyrinogen III oxidase